MLAVIKSSFKRGHVGIYVPPCIRSSAPHGSDVSEMRHVGTEEASAALLGNAQQKHWYRQYLGIAVEELRD